MKHFKYHIFITFSFLSLTQCSYQGPVNEGATKKTEYQLSDFDSLAKLHTKLGEPGPSDWLSWHDEKGQSFQEYCVKKPICPNDSVNKIYILPIGDFNEIEKRLLRSTAEYVRVFFMLKVELLEPVSDKIIPKKSRRLNFGIEQLQTYYIFDSIIIPKFPRDAICYTAITNIDLYPDENWNFVFGQANLAKRVGVSSFHRFYNNKLDSSNYEKCFIRNITTTTHELCHMFSIKHCKTYECLINGANNLEEADRNPLWLCPECLAKLQWCIKFNLIKRYDRLIDYFNRYKLDKEKEFYRKSREIMYK